MQITTCRAVYNLFVLEREKVPVLWHRGDIPEEYLGITDMAEAEEKLRKVVPGQIKETCTPDRKAAYPHADIEGMVREYAKIIVAVNTGNAEIISEWEDKKGGKRNFDGVCGPCGNIIFRADGQKSCYLAEKAIREGKK